MNEYEYYSRRTTKTKLLDFFRDVFRLRPLERMLAALTNRSEADSPVWALVPREYRFRPGSWRTVERWGLQWRLDISHLIDHHLYFGLPDSSLESFFRSGIIHELSVFLDVGANIGLVALQLATRFPQATVVCFEPDTVNHARLAEHIRLNQPRTKNVLALRKGLAETPGHAKLFKIVERNPGMNRILPSSDAEIPYEQIDLSTIDEEVFRMLNLGRVDFIKIDVEGYEWKVLRGGERTLDKFHPTLFIELDDMNLRSQSSHAKMLVEWLEAKGYEIYDARTLSPLSRDGDFSECHFDILCISKAKTHALAKGPGN